MESERTVEYKGYTISIYPNESEEAEFGEYCADIRRPGDGRMVDALSDWGTVIEIRAKSIIDEWERHGIAEG